MQDQLRTPAEPTDPEPGGLRHQRKWERVRRRLKVTFRHGPSFSVDVSRGGFCVELLRVLPAGAPVEGTVQVKGKEMPFAGLVAWSRAGMPYLGLRGRMGVQLIQCAPAWAEALET